MLERHITPYPPPLQARNLMEQIARRSPHFRRGCVALARSFENSEIAKRNRYLKLGEVELVELARMTDEQAVHRGAEIFGEAVIWGIGGAAVVHQFWREQETEAADEAAEVARLAASEAAVCAAVAAAEARLAARLEVRLDSLDAAVAAIAAHRPTAADPSVLPAAAIPASSSRLFAK